MFKFHTLLPFQGDNKCYIWILSISLILSKIPVLVQLQCSLKVSTLRETTQGTRVLFRAVSFSHKEPGHGDVLWAAVMSPVGSSHRPPMQWGKLMLLEQWKWHWARHQRVKQRLCIWLPASPAPAGRQHNLPRAPCSISWTRGMSCPCLPNQQGLNTVPGLMPSLRGLKA